MNKVKWYHFWNPLSGLFGGMIAGLVSSAVFLGIPALITILL